MLVSTGVFVSFHANALASIVRKKIPDSVPLWHSSRYKPLVGYCHSAHLAIFSVALLPSSIPVSTMDPPVESGADSTTEPLTFLSDIEGQDSTPESSQTAPTSGLSQQGSLSNTQEIVVVPSQDETCPMFKTGDKCKVDFQCCSRKCRGNTRNTSYCVE